jgi:hypothetical protein
MKSKAHKHAELEWERIGTKIRSCRKNGLVEIYYLLSLCHRLYAEVWMWEFVMQVGCECRG